MVLPCSATKKRDVMNIFLRFIEKHYNMTGYVFFLEHVVAGYGSFGMWVGVFCVLDDLGPVVRMKSRSSQGPRGQPRKASNDLTKRSSGLMKSGLKKRVLCGWTFPNEVVYFFLWMHKSGFLNVLWKDSRLNMSRFFGGAVISYKSL